LDGLPGLQEAMTLSDDPRRHPHDWHSAAFVENWIGQDATDDERRRPTLQRVAALLPGGPDGRLRVLDVGGGYGALSYEVLHARPQASVVLHDYSTAMIAKASERLARFADRVSYATADMADPGWAGDLGGPFDAVVSALAIHNIDTAAIPRVYRDIFTLLRPGGCFFDADLAFPAGPGEADLYRRDPVRDPRWDVYTGLPGLEDHLRWLREAGFGEAACVWKDCEDTLLWALRSQ
jgi:tRNA (cmo5U34)-methyltransferase